MSYILTLVSSSNNYPLTDAHFKEIRNIAEHYNIKYTSKLIWLDKKIAAEIGVSRKFQSSMIDHLRDELSKHRIDFFVTKNAKRKKKLLIADMDSTITTSETLDELAAFAGIKDQIAEITTRAMEGRLDFHEALKERVKLLKGLDTASLSKTLDETKLSTGAKIFVNTMQKNGATCVLVSGGFTFFTNAIAKQCGFNFNHGNTLEIEENALTGNVILPILDKFSKVKFLEQHMKNLNITSDECLGIGDGANDIPMLKTSGLGVGYKPKNTVKSEIPNCIIYGNLTAALYAQGYSKKHFEIN